MNTERIIRVRDSKTQKTYKITTNASTVGELKEIFANNGINYQNMDITEGITKTTLNGDDNTPLPANIPFKGTHTNDLVILLTNTRKNIKSGMADRFSLYATIKEHDLQDEVKKTFGRNFTQVSSSDLEKFINDNDIVLSQEVKKEVPQKELSAKVEEIPDEERTVLSPTEIVLGLVDNFYENGLLEYEDMIAIAKELVNYKDDHQETDDYDDIIAGDITQEEVNKLAEL